MKRQRPCLAAVPPRGEWRAWDSRFRDTALTAIAAALDSNHRDDPEPSPEWMNVNTAARYLDVSTERVRKLVARREIPFTQEAPGCRVFFSRSDLDAWMRSSAHPWRGGGA
jgi:excisionase family DNA binding protein